MKKNIGLILIILSLVVWQNVNAQESQAPPKKSKKAKSNWIGNGFFHTGFRPGNWEIDQLVAIPKDGKIYKNGVKGGASPLYLSVEQITQFIYWNMDMSAMFGKQNYEFTQSSTSAYFQDGETETFKTVNASFMGSAGYLWHGRWGIYAGFRFGYDNTITKYFFGIPGEASLSHLGGVKKGGNIHFFIPVRRSMLRISFYGENMKNGEYGLKAKTKETEINYCIPFNKIKSSGLMLKYNKMSYSTTDYNSSLKSMNNGAAINYKRGYFQIGFILPIFKELSPDACLDCSGKGYNVAAGDKCTTCGGSGGKVCGGCNGQGLIVTDVTRKCAYCHGTGKVNCSTCAGLGTMELLKKNRCDVCHGSGKKTKK